MNPNKANLLCGAVAMLLAGCAIAGAAESQDASKLAAKSATTATVETAYPGLASGALAMATLGELPDGTRVRAGEIAVTDQDLQAIASKAPAELQGQVSKNAFFFVEQIATRKLLLAAAAPGLKAPPAGKEAGADEAQRIQEYLKGVAGQVSVSDSEIANFYEKNKDMVGGAPLDAVKDTVRAYLQGEKQQKAVDAHIRAFGRRVPIVVSAAWAKEQAALAKDNPVDKARSSGRPSMVDFGADGCRPCDMMTPILASLKTKFEGKLNVDFVHVQQEPILAARYGIQSIPVQVFFDKDGKEVSRHVGFFPQAEIEKQLAEMGVQ